MALLILTIVQSWARGQVKVLGHEVEDSAVVSGRGHRFCKVLIMRPEDISKSSWGLYEDIRGQIFTSTSACRVQVLRTVIWYQNPHKGNVRTYRAKYELVWHQGLRTSQSPHKDFMRIYEAKYLPALQFAGFKCWGLSFDTKILIREMWGHMGQNIN